MTCWTLMIIWLYNGCPVDTTIRTLILFAYTYRQKQSLNPCRNIKKNNKIAETWATFS